MGADGFLDAASVTGRETQPACPRSGTCSGGHRRHHTPFWIIPFLGLVSLLWMLIRVVPKPSRAAYPCQRIAAPLAGGFLIWITATVGSVLALRRSRELLRRSRWLAAASCLAVTAGLGILALRHAPDNVLLATDEAGATQGLAEGPFGVAKGLKPGRVTWAHDPGATDWKGPGYGHWWEPAHTSQPRVDRMLSAVVRALSGEQSDAAAWSALIRHCNRERGRGDVGYTPGEKVAIKVNLVGCIANSWGGVNADTYDLVSKLDYMNTSPQVMLALLRQLVNVVGVAPADISIGDPVCLFPNQYYNMLAGEFPQVRYLDHNGGNAAHPRAAIPASGVRFYWSCRPGGKTADYIPQPFAEATYFINLANLKSHTAAGVTLCAKNYYGFLNRIPVETGFYDLHASLPFNITGAAQYRALVDLMGHAHTGGKALLYLIDGLYAGVHPIEESPRRWLTPPFNNDWTSSLMASQDPVAIDSVGLDFLRAEWTNYPLMPGTDDYLHEAAQANAPPSGIFYDPNHAVSTTRLASLGVHEHWNNATERKYSRNLGTGAGIELVPVGPPRAVIQVAPRTGRAPLDVAFDGSGSFDSDGTIVGYAWDLDGDGTDDKTGAVVDYRYVEAGEYSARLTVTDNDGQTDSANVLISVQAQRGDFDADLDVDQQDFGRVQACLGGPGVTRPESCRNADLDGDHDVDQQDMSLFMDCMSGPSIPADCQ